MSYAQQNRFWRCFSVKSSYQMWLLKAFELHSNFGSKVYSQRVFKTDRVCGVEVMFISVVYDIKICFLF